MDTSQAEVIKKCRNDLQKERVIKSVLCGMAVGFAVMFLLAFITWIFEFKGLWLTLGLGVGAWIGASLIFYFAVFTFNDIDVMRRIDRAGLDERMITMYQLQGDQSYMAQRQRADASAAFSAAVKASGGRLVATKIATAIICAAAIAGPIGAGMTVVTGLSDYGVIPTLGALVSDGSSGFGRYTAPTYTVTYLVGGVKEEGLVNEKEKVVDRVQKGGTSSVTASVIDSDKYYIAGWIDQNNVEYKAASTEFVVSNVQKSMTFTAIVAAYDDGEGGGFGYYYDPSDQDGDENQDSPRNPNGDGKGGPNAPETPPDNTPPPSPGPGGGKPTAPGNAVVDGETQYGENFDSYYGDAMDSLTNESDGYPPELTDMIESYFGTL